MPFGSAGGGTPLSLVVSPAVRYSWEGSGCCVSQFSFGGSARLILQFRERLALDLRVAEPFESPAAGSYPYPGASFLAAWRPISATFGATYAASQHVDLRGEIGVLNVNSAYPPGDYRSFGAFISVRP